MNRLSLSALLAVAASAAAAPLPTPVAAPPPSTKRPVVPFEVFFQNLKAYGSWLALEEGHWVWRPDSASRDWRPFGTGTWVITKPHSETADSQSEIQNPISKIENPQWYWLADEPWGWATSHYGRWLWREFSIRNPKSEIQNPEKGGWVWLPDREWSPAWVTWRQGEMGIGWHPMPEIANAQSEIREGSTFLLWINISQALIARSSTPNRPRPANALEALGVSSSTAVGATADLLSQTRLVTSFEKQGGGMKGVGPDRTLVESKTGRRLASCRIVDTNQPREILIVGRDETVVLAFRPIVKESSSEMQQFLSRRAEQYRTIQQQKSK